MEITVQNSANVGINPRTYQWEMFHQSMAQNTIVAMDTGTGKTAVAILRMQAELERDVGKRMIWFLAPTVALCEQQFSVIQKSLPAFPCRLLRGKDGVDTWRSQESWDKALQNIRIVVSTHQILLDALIHAFVSLQQLSLIVFDEAHHCTSSHPASRIMSGFYHEQKRAEGKKLPFILGLSASPVVRNNAKSLSGIESNLDAITRSPKIHRADMLKYAHRPVMSTELYSTSPIPKPPLLQLLAEARSAMDIEEDPYVKMLKLEEDSKYYETLIAQKTYCMENVKSLFKTAVSLNDELGPWMSHVYIATCVDRNLRPPLQTPTGDLDLEEQEILYLSNLLTPLIHEAPIPSLHSVSPKVLKFVELLSEHMDDDTTAIAFVQTRASVYLLARFLTELPTTRDILRIGTFVGTSESVNRSRKIGEIIDSRDQKSTLKDLRSRKLNLVICTSVCEEGIDISACNLVLCFQPPPNLKSFIQRRGRARKVKSNFVLMLPEGASDSILQWQRLEDDLTEQYMDDLRQLQTLHELEDGEIGHMEFRVPSTGAKITLHEAVSHLYHFCSRLPQAAHTALTPIFTFEGESAPNNPRTSCKVLLPSCVDDSVREFRSKKLWETETMARKDAAFQAYTGLFGAGLLDDHLLPFQQAQDPNRMDYETIFKRPGFADVEELMNPWATIAMQWKISKKLYIYSLHLTYSNGEGLLMKMIVPDCIIPPPDIRLYLNAEISLRINISSPDIVDRDENLEAAYRRATHLLLHKAFPNRIEDDKDDFSILFIPDIAGEVSKWTDEYSCSYPGTTLLNSPKVGAVVRDLSKWGKQRVFLTTKLVTEDSEGVDKVYLDCARLPYARRLDFLHPISPNNTAPQERKTSLLNPEVCEVDLLPVEYVLFGRLIPSIMHSVSTTVVAATLCEELLSSAGLSLPMVVLPAICTPQSREVEDYERSEFLGDSLLKVLVSASLMVEHPTWHEGYLSNRKDCIVTNGRLARAAQETGLCKYIIHTAFTGHKWRPWYNDAALATIPKQQRTMSTKTIADVVEALIGTAFVDGGLSTALTVLRIFLPEVSADPLADGAHELRQKAALKSQKVQNTQHIEQLETIIDHAFVNKQLLLEAITHPSHIGSLNTSSYDRLEFLGDALLDYLVTNTVYRFPGPNPTEALPVGRLHLLRTATVNSSFLAFQALCASVCLPVAELPATSESYAQRRNSSANREPAQWIERDFSLPLFLRHAASLSLTAALNASRKRFKALRPQLEQALSDKSNCYPWRLLAAFSPDKVYSDLVESTLAAIWVDTGGDFGACEKFLRRLGILGWLEDALLRNIKVWHPKEEVGQLAAGERVRYKVWKDGSALGEETVEEKDIKAKPLEEDDEATDGNSDDHDELAFGIGRWACKIVIGGKEMPIVGGWNRLEVETAAAEEAIKVLKSE